MTTSQILLKLLALESISGHEEAILDFIESYLRELNAKPVRVGQNLVLKIPGRDHSRAVIFNAHVDTVSFGNAEKWKFSRTGQIAGPRIYGLGASDEKATVAVLLQLAKTWMETPPAIDIWFMWVVNEEVDGSGTLEAVEWFARIHKPKYAQIAAILGEPTALKTIETAHKGNLFLQITTSGASGHGSQPVVTKKHAIFKMVYFAEQLDKLGQIWAKKYPDAVLGVPTVGLLTSITAGHLGSPNKFPDTCEATFDIRTTPKLSHTLVLTEIQKIDRQAKLKLVYPAVGCGYTSPNEVIVQVAQKVTRARIGASFSSNDLNCFTKFHIPGIVLGPGEPEAMHGIDEYCVISKLNKCQDFYERIVVEFAHAPI